MSIADIAGWAGLIAAALAGRFVARRSLPESRSVFVGWAGASVGVAMAFVFGLCIFPPIVVDPLMVLAQLPFFGGLVGAATEVFVQAYEMCRKRQSWSRGIRNIAVMVLVGAACYGALALYDWYHHRHWRTEPATIEVRDGSKVK
jgi:hypothetical protein